MTRRSYGTVLCWCLIVLMPTAVLLAQTPAAMVYASGEVMLNGAAVPRSSAVFVGDRLATSANGAFTLTLTGSTITVGASSFLTYLGTAIELHSGTVAVATSSGLIMLAGAIRVSPATANGTSRYEVTRLAGKVIITAREGALVVVEDGAVTELAPGQTTERRDDSRKRAAPPLPGQAAGSSATKPVLIGTAAAGAAAAVVAILTTHMSASPVRP